MDSLVGLVDRKRGQLAATVDDFIGVDKLRGFPGLQGTIVQGWTLAHYCQDGVEGSNPFSRSNYVADKAAA